VRGKFIKETWRQPPLFLNVHKYLPDGGFIYEKKMIIIQWRSVVIVKKSCVNWIAYNSICY